MHVLDERGVSTKSGKNIQYEKKKEKLEGLSVLFFSFVKILFACTVKFMYHLNNKVTLEGAIIEFHYCRGSITSFCKEK